MTVTPTLHCIYKYEITPQNLTVQMPVGAQVLSAGAQGGRIFVWAKVQIEPAVQLELRHFRAFGTGHGIDSPLGRFINTVQMYDGLVFHVFEAA
jgi:hypothetical protein